VDTSAGILGDLSAYARIAGRALDALPCDAVLCYLAHIARNPAHWAQLREPLAALRRQHADKAFAVVGLADAEITAWLEQQRFAVFTDPSQAVLALAACAPPLHALGLNTQPAAMSARVVTAPVATEHQAKAALAAQGIAFAPEAFAADADAAVQAAAALGWPVVLKVVSPDIAHKTEAGGVMLGIADAAALRAAIPAMRDRVLTHQPGARIDGFIVARQLQGGVELLLGAHDDPVFGPVVTVGAGGVLAELIADVQLRLAPLAQAEALSMLHGTRIGRLLAGWRGAPAADLDALARQIVVLSEVAWANRGRFAGIDLNPVLARPDGAYALDALIVCKEASA
jgi:acyl-CoA synthetase (NDP forming)